MIGDVDDDDQIPRGPADLPGLSLAAEPQLRAAVHPCGDSNLHPSLGLHPAASAALGARLLDETSFPPAARARAADLEKALGADHVIDYTKEDFTQSGETYDLIFDILGKSSFSRCKKSLKSKGIQLFASFKMKQLFQMLWTSLIGDKKVICAIAPGSLADLISVKELVEAGKIKAIIDRCYPLEQAAEAHRYVEQGHKQGQVVITV